MDRASGSWSRQQRQPRTSVDHDDEPYDGIGAELRNARGVLGYDIAQVAEALRIRVPQVEAIEEGRFDDLPGATYAAGFLRSYARLLGIDPETVVAAFREEAEGLRAPTKLEFPLPPDEGNRPGLALIVVSLLVAGAIYGAWHGRSSESRIDLTVVSELPERLFATVTDLLGSNAPRRPPGTGNASAAPAPEASESGAEAAAVVAATEPAAGPMTGTVGGGEAGTGEARVVSRSEADAPAAGAALAAAVSEDEEADTPPPAPEGVAIAGTGADGVSAPPPLPTVAAEPGGAAGYVPRTFGAANKDARVVLKARADSWVQIQGANSELVLTRMLRAGDTYQVPNRDDLVMMTGNAGGIIFVVDGKAFPPMGPDGEVRRNIPLSPEELLARVAASR